AVILYSMGIFNPSSSVTFTSSGFSPFTVSSSLCNNLGYKIAVIAGPIPNNANSLTIDKVYLTSATGANTTAASYTLTNPITLTSGQTATILIPNVACTSAGIHYSLSASIQYSYSTTAGNVVTNTTGTVAGTSIPGKPSVLTSYEPVTITNTQNSATPSPFQQMLVFNSTDPGWTSISTGNFGQNVEFFYYNGTVIPSWLESYTADNATWWLKIASVPAGSSETIYVGFAPTSTNLFNTANDGEAPQLSATYAQYDDGANVFQVYYNFASGTSIYQFAWVYSPNYNVQNTYSVPTSTISSDVSIDNGLVITTNSTDIIIGYFTESGSGLDLSHYGILVQWNNYNNGGTIYYGISINAGVPGPTFGQIANESTIISAPPPRVYAPYNGQFYSYFWMSNETLNTTSDSYDVTGNWLINGKLYQNYLVNEFGNRLSETWGYEFGYAQGNTDTYPLHVYALTNAVNQMPFVRFGGVS
ncbi:MAG: hypothetical protein ACP5MV_04240, partial [Candidatus Parvarchaeum sp.]